MANNFSQRCPEMMALLRHTEDSIFFKDMDGRFTLVSEAKAKKSCARWEDMIGKTDFDFLPLEEARRCRDDEIFIMETGESIVDKEEELTRSNGSKSWLSVSKFPWKDIDGEPIGVIGISRDITQRKKLEKLARQQGKSIAEVTRQAIDIGLEKLSVNERQEQILAALEAARKLRESMPMLDIDIVADLHQIREERDDALFSGS